jgi:hypothetical protein
MLASLINCWKGASVNGRGVNMKLDINGDCSAFLLLFREREKIKQKISMILGKGL